MKLDWKSRPTGDDSAFHLWAVFQRWSLAALSLLLVFSVGCQAGSTPVSTAPGVTLALLGDVMLGRDVHPSVNTFAYLKPFLADADLTLANLESPLSSTPPQTASPYMLCAPPENVKTLAESGFDLLTLANNHHLDCGQEGLEDTQATLLSAGLGFIGPDPVPVYRTINNISLAFLAFDATGEFSLETATKAVRLARETGAVVIVSLHWGMEYQSGATESQKQIAGQIANAGAALIWGHHPHVLQPAEWLNIGQTLVLYSLGNALFDQRSLESTRQSALALIKFSQAGVVELRAIPFEIDITTSRVREPDQITQKTISHYFETQNEP